MKQFLLGSLLFLAAVQQPPAGGGIQFFSIEQDKEIGSASAAEVDASLPLIRTTVDSYFRGIGTALKDFSPLTGLQYRFRIVNTRTVNAVTFPGGKVYVDRGLVEMTSNEHELAAILAHEIAHASARHGTRQLSGQLLVQAPASVLAGLPTNEGWKARLAQLGIPLGAGAPFLRYSPEQEIEANTLAVGILLKAGYSPYALPAIFEKINVTAGESKSLPAYAFNHPQGAEAARRLDAEITKHKARARTLRPSPEFQSFHALLSKVTFPTAPPVSSESELPNVHQHPANYYQLRYPDMWLVRPISANGAIIAPVGGIQPTTAGDDVRRGVMFDLFSIPEQMTLDQATNRLIIHLKQRNQDLRLIPGAQSQTLMGTVPALRTVLSGTSKTNESTRRSPEFVWLVTGLYYESLFYIVCVAPEDEFPALQPVFEQVIRSIQLR